MNVQREAELRAAVILKRIGATKPATVILSDYEDEATHSFLIPEPRWTLTEFRAVNEAVASQLRARGHNVTIRTIRLNEFFDWLTVNDLPNNPQTRAAFVGCDRPGKLSGADATLLR